MAPLHRAQRSRPRTRNALLGATLGLGAPVGYLVLRLATARRRGERMRPLSEVRRRRLAYGYLGLTTPVAFALFGHALGRREEELREAHGEIHRLREEFIAVVAHDLKNPIQAILVQSKLMRRRAHEGQVTVPLEFLERLERTGERLRRLANDLLDASLIEAHRLTVLHEPLSLSEAVRHALDVLRPSLADHPLELDLREPSSVLADSIRIEQIVTNLVDNAAKFSPSGSLITVRVRPRAGGALLSVEDRGIGIAEEEQARLFDRFYQAKRSREQKTGLGLGLYITKGLVDAHGGRIFVDSELGVGSTFSVWLPGPR